MIAIYDAYLYTYVSYGLGDSSASNFRRETGIHGSAFRMLCDGADVVAFCNVLILFCSDVLILFRSVLSMHALPLFLASSGCAEKWFA